MDQMVRFDSSLEVVDIRNFDIDSTTSLIYLVQSTNIKTKFIVKNDEIGQILQNAFPSNITYEVAN